MTLGGSSQSRADVYPDDARDIAPVYYEKDVDKLIVVYKGNYVGEITCTATHDYHPDDPSYPTNYYDASADFSGTITIANSDDIDNSAPLYFYYVGNFAYTVSGGNIIVDISDQRSKLPVISFAASKEAFNGNGTYTVYNGYNGDGHHWLLNQCALVKFECENIYDMSANTNDNNSYAIYKTTKDITIYGMDNKVTIGMNSTLTSPNFSWSQDGAAGTGAIKLHTLPKDAAGDGSVRYAIVHHKNYTSVIAERLEVPFNSKSDPYGFFGTYKIAHDVVKNEYFDGGKIDLVWHSGAFSVSDSGDTIVFSRGNLQYAHRGSASPAGGTWRFAKHQYDWVGGYVSHNNSGLLDPNDVRQGHVVLREDIQDDPNFSDNEKIGTSGYMGWIDLFGWGTGNDPMNTSVVNDNYTDWHEWGANPIVNSGTPSNTAFWVSLRHNEWDYLVTPRGDVPPSEMGAAQITGVSNTGTEDGTINGIILTPDNYSGPAITPVSFVSIGGVGLTWTITAEFTDNQFTESQWRDMEAQGCVFLPACGYRDSDDNFDGGLKEHQNRGVYWSFSQSTTHASWALRFQALTTSDVFAFEDDYPMAPDNGHGVRLVPRISTSSGKFGFNKKP